MKDEKYENGGRPRGRGMGRRDLMSWAQGRRDGHDGFESLGAARGWWWAGAAAGPDGVSFALPVRTRAGYVYDANGNRAMARWTIRPARS